MRALAAAALAAFALAGAGPVRAGAQDSLDGGGLTPAQVLARYAAALAKVKPVTVVTFDYTVEQLGLRDMEQTHRVYRGEGNERDETTVVDGQALTNPEVRIFAKRAYRYEFRDLAPTPATYSFAYTGAHLENDDVVYVFRTTPLSARNFAVSEIEIPSRRFLPTILRFKIATASASGSGQLNFGPSDDHWVVLEAQINARLGDGSAAHERIEWSDYQFPPSLPPSTFMPPREPPSLSR